MGANRGADRGHVGRSGGSRLTKADRARSGWIVADTNSN